MTDPKRKPSPKPRDGSFSGKLPAEAKATAPAKGRNETAHEKQIREGLEKFQALQDANRVAKRRKLPKPKYDPKHKLGHHRKD